MVAPASVRLWGRGSRVHAAVSERLGEATRCLLLAFPILPASSWIALTSTANQREGKANASGQYRLDPLSQVLSFGRGHPQVPLVKLSRWSLPSRQGVAGIRAAWVWQGWLGHPRLCAGSCTFLRALLRHKGSPRGPLQKEEASVF